MDEQSKESLQQEIDNANDVIKKLETFTNELEKKPDNILTHLCDGLETFLGFDSTSKGYDGSGIVYSDLDRLCDGVMGFLSGVLGAVKDDEAVKTYDKNISTGDLSSVLKTLTSSIGSGRTGLAESVDAVKRWLGKYNEKVEELTTAVTTKLGKLRHKLSSPAGEYYKRVYEHTDLSAQLTMWTTTLGHITAELHNIETDEINELDDALKNSVMHEMKPMQKSVDLLLRAANNSELVKQADKVDWALVKHKENIERTLREEFRDINAGVQFLENAKNQQIGHLNKAMKNANKLVDELNWKYKDPIEGFFDVIQTEVGNVYHTLMTHKIDLLTLIKNAQKHFAGITRGVKEGSATAGQADLSIEKHWNTLKKEITSLVGDLNGTGVGDPGPPKKGLLRNIENGISNYAEQFKRTRDDGNQSFRSVVEHWLADILQSGPMKTTLKTYNVGNMSGNLDDIAGVAKKIADVFESEVEAAVVVFNSTIVGNGDIENLILGINAACEKFATALETKITSGQTTAMEKSIGAALYPTSRMAEHILSVIAQPIFLQLVGAARQVGKEIYAFAGDQDSVGPDDSDGYNLGKNLKMALTLVGRIATNITSATGNRITETLELVKSKIDHLDEVLGNDGAGRLIHGKIEEIQQQYGELQKMIKLEEGTNNSGLISKKKNEAAEKLRDLKTNMKDLVELIDVAVGQTNDLLDNAINELRDAINDAHENIKLSVTTTFATLTSEVRTLFSDAHKADLAALKTLVDGQKQEIEKIIEEDRRNGVKGLLTKLYGGEFSTPSIPPKPKPNNLLTKIEESVPKSPPGKPNPEDLKKFPEVVKAFNTYADPILIYIGNRLMTPVKTGGLPTDQSEKVRHLKDALDSLLHYLKHNGDLTRQYLFDHHFDDLLASLNSLVTSLSPSFSSPSPLLSPLKAGLRNFTEQLSHAYVSRYSGVKMGELVVKKQPPKDQKPAEKQLPDTSLDNYDLTTEGRNCAKVCLTIVDMVMEEMEKICRACNNNKTLQINLEDGNKLGSLFYSRGYRVATEVCKQDGELRNKDAAMTGTKIMELCVKKITLKEHNALLGVHKDDSVPLYVILRYLTERIDDYSSVCHLKHIGSPKAPTNVNQMLHWLSGLRHNSVYGPLCKYFKQVIPKPEKYKETSYDKIPDDEMNLPATTEIKYKDFKPTLVDVCAFARRMLVCILGHGHAGGRYACEFSTNADGLDYPSSASACFDTLVDTLNRVYHQFSFLYKQCCSGPENTGWEQCWYGRDVAGSDWRCNKMQCPNQICDQKDNQIGNQIHKQMGDQHPGCGLKSPLQSFLEDGLPGFLPHSFKKPGCKLECTVSNHRGIPCITPMGFAGIAQMASRASRGKRMKEVLERFCSDADKPLPKLCGYFITLMQTPPQTLGDMFAFYYNLLNRWDATGRGSDECLKHKKNAFNTAVQTASFGFYDVLDITALFKSREHKNTHDNGDLFSLYMCDYDEKSEIICGRYMHPYGIHTWTVFYEKCADKYLSWIVYSTETFYNLLQQLYEECCNNCTKAGTRCHDKNCVENCEVKSYHKSQASTSESKTAVASKHPNHNEQCSSIATCPFTRPTLSKYGFVLQSRYNLSGTNGVESKRTCQDFCETLKRILNKERKLERAFAKLVHETIPNFLFTIRAPFIWTTLALWLLSLLYLIHIMVIRLDLLHIKSHLHSPSSHRIAAQSLLAAARVNKLNRVFYLQP